MNTLKNGKQNAKTTNLTLHVNDAHDLENNIALSLLLGSYNKLRRYSNNDKPINIDKLRELQQKFDNLLHDVKQEMNVNIFDVDKF